MGDHRAHIKIDFFFHGKKYNLDCSINYDGHDGPLPCLDRRVYEFFEKSWNDGMSKYDDLIEEARIQETEHKERELLEDLKAKYENPEL